MKHNPTEGTTVLDDMMSAVDKTFIRCTQVAGFIGSYVQFINYLAYVQLLIILPTTVIGGGSNSIFVHSFSVHLAKI